MNPRAEAEARLGGRYEARVLEPSPPAVPDPPWYADWCGERWLAAAPRLARVLPALVTTRTGLHRLAEAVLGPARRQANGKFGLRWTRGGFGTSFFGADRQVRVDGTELVIVDGTAERRAPITTLAAAGGQLGSGWLPRDGPLDDVPLDVDAAAVAFIGQFYGLATRVLETLRAGSTAEQEPSRVQLWQSEGFSGAELSYATLAAADCPVSAALAFFAPRRDALTG